MKLPAALLLALALGPAIATGLRALGIFPMTAHSHNIFFKALMTGLADRGHQVTMVSPYPLKSPRPNYTDVDLTDVLPSLSGQFTIDMMTGISVPVFSSVINMMTVLQDVVGEDTCRKVFSHPEFQRLLKDARGKYDVVLTEVCGSDCFAAVAHWLRVPLISLTSLPDVPSMHGRLGSIDNPSYLPIFFSEFSGKMSFYERLVNTGEYLLYGFLHRRTLQDRHDAVVREFFGEDMPPISEIVQNTSLVIVNSHMSLQAARPLTPNVVHAGGMHIQPPQPLDPALDLWLRGAEQGVVVFSLGSVMRGASMPVATRDALLRAFSAIPQRVIWKFESDDIRDVPANVRISPWLPQRDVLAHPNTVLFITHGGLMGTTEAVLSGVPMLGMPLHADQKSNVKLYKSLGIAELVDIIDFDERIFTDTLRKMTEDGRYRAQAKVMAARLSDRPRSALEEAVWWVEYVVRHRGAPHLRPLGADLPWYQYLLLDVAAAAVLALAAIGATAGLTARAALRFILHRKAKAE